MPGFSELGTAYGALAYHFSRYGDNTDTPLPESLTKTLERNVGVAQKAIKRAQAAAASSETAAAS